MADFKNGDTANWNKEEVREAQQKRRRKKRRRNPILAILLHLTLVLLLSAMLAGIGWLLFSDFCSFNRGGITATIQVTADDTIGTISHKLLGAGVIPPQRVF